MPYYIRVLGTKDPDIQIKDLTAAAKLAALPVDIELAEGEPDNWTLLDVTNERGQPLAQIERNPVLKGELGKEELDEFKERILDFKPVSAVKWLEKYLNKVKVIYAFQILNAAFDEDNYHIVNAIRAEIWRQCGGILQGDNEGFTNEEGYHLLWQFSDGIDGEWNCAVLDSSGNWQKFVINLGDPKQRDEFKEGRVPKAARLL